MPNVAGWNHTNISVTWNVQDPETGIAASSGCSTTSFVTETASTILTCSATNGVGLSSSASITLMIDKSAPTVTFANHPSTYLVDQQVDIACVAIDVLSGIASTTCQNIHGPAYSFNLLPSHNTFSASATDRADNTGNGSTSFDVKVTCGSLGNLTLRFLTNKSLGQSAQSKLNAICAAANPRVKTRAIQAYIQFVQFEQARHELTANQATILIRLARAL